MVAAAVVGVRHLAPGPPPVGADVMDPTQARWRLVPGTGSGGPPPYKEAPKNLPGAPCPSEPPPVVQRAASLHGSRRRTAQGQIRPPDVSAPSVGLADRAGRLAGSNRILTSDCQPAAT